MEGFLEDYCFIKKKKHSKDEQEFSVLVENMINMLRDKGKALKDEEDDIVRGLAKQAGFNIMDKNIIICNSLTKLVTDISREIGYLDSREGQTKNDERKARIVKMIETGRAQLDDYLALLDAKEKPEKVKWKPEIGFTEEGCIKIKMPFIVRDRSFDIWLQYRTCVAEFFEEFIVEHVDKPLNDCLFYARKDSKH